MTGNPVMIQTNMLTKRFGDLTAVENLNLTVEAGELFAFLGPNGAGKTTTIKMLTGIILPTSGSASIAGLDIVKSALEVKKLIGYLPDEPFLYNKLTGREFLNFIADIRKVQRKRDKIDKFLELFELDSSADDLIEGYSLGMKKKIAIGAALLHDPKVLFLDEPTSGLDPRSARVMKDLLRDLSNKGTTVFMSTHILEVAEKMCDRVGIIDHGKLIKIGTIEELKKGTKDISLEDVFLELTGKKHKDEIGKFLSDVVDNNQI